MVAAIAGVASICTFGYVAWLRGWFPQPPSLSVSTLSASKVLSINSSRLLTFGAFDNYAFDASGNRFDYRKAAARDGYVVQYSGSVSGIGKCEIDFVIMDSAKTKILTPKTSVEAIVITNSRSIGHEFFVQRVAAGEQLFVTVAVDNGTDRASIQSTNPVDLATNDIKESQWLAYR